MSAAATRPAPPPSAWPCTRATTGAGQASIASSIAAARSRRRRSLRSERSTEERIQSTSAPAEKLGPSPASTTARARPTSTNASASSAISAASNALRRSGRASVIRRTSPSRSIAEVLRHGEELRFARCCSGAIAAALTPLRAAALDEAAIAPYVDFLASHGVDGMLVLGTTGEGVLFDLDERREIARRSSRPAARGSRSPSHCGAQTTADTDALAEHAASSAPTRSP